MWIVQRIGQGGGYVSPPGSEKAYTKSPTKALIFETEIEASDYCCEENEIAVPLSTFLTFY